MIGVSTYQFLLLSTFFHLFKSENEAFNFEIAVHVRDKVADFTDLISRSIKMCATPFIASNIFLMLPFYHSMYAMVIVFPCLPQAYGCILFKV